jgi:hypothetical protein
MVYGGLAFSYLSFAPLPVFKNFLFALILIGLSNLFFYIAHVAIHSDIQQITPNEIRGKVFASSPTLLIPIALIFIFIATPLADRVGVEWVFLVSGLLALVTIPGVGYLSETFAQVFQIAPKRGADLSKSATL